GDTLGRPLQRHESPRPVAPLVAPFARPAARRPLPTLPSQDLPPGRSPLHDGPRPRSRLSLGPALVGTPAPVGVAPCADLTPSPTRPATDGTVVGAGSSSRGSSGVPCSTPRWSWSGAGKRFRGGSRACPPEAAGRLAAESNEEGRGGLHHGDRERRSQRARHRSGGRLGG